MGIQTPMWGWVGRLQQNGTSNYPMISNATPSLPFCEQFKHLLTYFVILKHKRVHALWRIATRLPFTSPNTHKEIAHHFVIISPLFSLWILYAAHRIAVCGAAVQIKKNTTLLCLSLENKQMKDYETGTGLESSVNVTPTIKLEEELTLVWKSH